MRIATALLALVFVCGCAEPLPGLGEEFSCASELRCLPDGAFFTIEPTVCADGYEDAYWQLYAIVDAKGDECPSGYGTEWVTCEPAGHGIRRPCDR